MGSMRIIAVHPPRVPIAMGPSADLFAYIPLVHRCTYGRVPATEPLEQCDTSRGSWSRSSGYAVVEPEENCDERVHLTQNRRAQTGDAP